MRQSMKGLWIVQLLEYGIGLLLASYASRAPEPLVPLLVGAAILLNAAMFDGPLSAFRVTKTSQHRIIGILLGVGASVLAVIATQDVTHRGALVLAGVAEVFISVRFGHGFRTTRTRPE